MFAWLFNLISFFVTLATDIVFAPFKLIPWWSLVAAAAFAGGAYYQRQKGDVGIGEAKKRVGFAQFFRGYAHAFA
jgi:hypothetical protein